MANVTKGKGRLRAVSGGGDHHHGIRTAGRFESVTAWGFCDCGWEGTRRAWWTPDGGPSVGERIAVELADHEADTGHGPVVAGVPAPEGYHAACGAFHGFDDDCLIPPGSPAGRVRRATAATSSDAVLALDRLRAVIELRAWLDDQEAEAVIGARLARATWAEMGAAIDSTRQAAFNRWGPTVKRYETAGLIPSVPDLPVVGGGR